jgi:hypothetical protein
VTLVKRLWHLTHLKEKWGLPTGPGEFKMPNLHSLADSNPFGDDQDAETDDCEKYFAVLAFDGDQIGKWISGEKTPPFNSQLADYWDSTHTERQGMLEYFERDPKFAAFLANSRPLSPSYHLQFSEALGNFAIHCAAAIVEGHDGRLIYCGGDDVLAVIPASKALECAADLNRAFTGEAPSKSRQPRLNLSNSSREGIVGMKSTGFLTSALMQSDDQTPIPFVVPGPGASASVGIAIAHVKAPLQDVVRAAHAAEKRAKNALGRSAVAISLFKRSGEITHWGTKWKSGGLNLYDAIASALNSEKLSSKFPHRLCQLLEPYLINTTGISAQRDAIECIDTAKQLIEMEFKHAALQQGSQEQASQLLPALKDYMNGILEARIAAEMESAIPFSSTAFQELLESIIGLCTTVAFTYRTQPSSPH